MNMEPKEQSNIERVRQIYRDFLQGNLDSVLNAMQEDVTVEGIAKSDLPHKFPYTGTHIGREKVAEGFRTFLGTVQYEHPTGPAQLVAQGDRVLVVGEDLRRVLATGDKIESRWSMLWTLREGKVVSLKVYEDSVEQL